MNLKNVVSFAGIITGVAIAAITVMPHYDLHDAHQKYLNAETASEYLSWWEKADDAPISTRLKSAVGLSKSQQSATKMYAQMLKDKELPSNFSVPNTPEWNKFFAVHMQDLLASGDAYEAQLREFWFDEKDVTQEKRHLFMLTELDKAAKEKSFTAFKNLSTSYAKYIPALSKENFSAFTALLKTNYLHVPDEIFTAWGARSFDEKNGHENEIITLGEKISSSPENVPDAFLSAFFRTLSSDWFTDFTPSENQQKTLEQIQKVNVSGLSEDEISVVQEFKKIQKEIAELRNKAVEKEEINEPISVTKLYAAMRKMNILGSPIGINKKQNPWKLSGFSYRGEDFSADFIPESESFTSISIGSQAFNSVPMSKLPSILNLATEGIKEDNAPKDTTPETYQAPKDDLRAQLKKDLIKDVFAEIEIIINPSNITESALDETYYHIENAIAFGRYTLSAEYDPEQDMLFLVNANRGKKKYFINEVPRKNLEAEINKKAE